MRWPDLDAIDRSRAIVLFVFSPIEEHGHHLPLNTDIVEAWQTAEAGFERFLERHPDWTILRHPPVPIGVDTLAMPGSFEVPANVVRDVAFALGNSMARFGFTRQLFWTFHGGARQPTSLVNAAHRLAQRYGGAGARRRMARLPKHQRGPLPGRFLCPWDDFVSNVWKLPGYDKPLPDAHLEALLNKHEGDLHAGLTETSLMLLYTPEHVAEHKSLPKVIVNRREMFKHRNDFGCVANGHGYVGYPGAATTELGRTIHDYISARLDEYVEELAFGDEATWRKRARGFLSRVFILHPDAQSRAWALLATLAMIGAIALAFFLGRILQ